MRTRVPACGCVPSCSSLTLATAATAPSAAPADAAAAAVPPPAAAAAAAARPPSPPPPPAPHPTPPPAWPFAPLATDPAPAGATLAEQLRALAASACPPGRPYHGLAAALSARPALAAAALACGLPDRDAAAAAEDEARLEALWAALVRGVRRVRLGRPR